VGERVSVMPRDVRLCGEALVAGASARYRSMEAVLFSGQVERNSLVPRWCGSGCFMGLNAGAPAAIVGPVSGARVALWLRSARPRLECC
jgi:hypothetical protein